MTATDDWRSLPPTDAQRRLFEVAAFGAPPATRGEACDRIAAAVEVPASRRGKFSAPEAVIGEDSPPRGTPARVSTGSSSCVEGTTMTTDRATNILSDDALLRDPREQGPRAYYAGRDAENGPWGTAGASVREALENYLDDCDPEEDDSPIYVTIGRPIGPPDLVGVRHLLVDRTCDENWHEQAAQRLSDALTTTRSRSLDDAVNAAIRAWFDANLPDLFAGWWIGYGRSIETTVREAREWLGRERS